MSNGMYHPPGYGQPRSATTGSDPRMAAVSNQLGPSTGHVSNSQNYAGRYQDVGPAPRAGNSGGVVGSNGYASRYAQDQLDRRDHFPTTNHSNNSNHQSHRVEPPRLYGSSEQYLPATSVASNHTAPTSAASIAGYRSMAEDAQYSNSMNKGYGTSSQQQQHQTGGYGRSNGRIAAGAGTNTTGEKPYVSRHVRDMDGPPASGLPALASASEVAQTYERQQQASAVITSTSASSLLARRTEYQPSRQTLDRPSSNVPVPSSSISPSYTPARTISNATNNSNNRPANPVVQAGRATQQTYTQQPRATATNVAPAVPAASSASQSSRNTNQAVNQARLGETWYTERHRAVQPNTAAQPSSNRHVDNQPHPAITVTIQEDDAYPVAPSPAYDPVVFERIIGLSHDPPSVETPRPYEAVESETDRRAHEQSIRAREAASDKDKDKDKDKDQAVHAQRHGISPSLLKNANGDSTRLQALVRATEPGQLEAWNQQTESDPPVTAGTEGEGSEQNQGAEEADPTTDGQGSKRVRQRKPRPKKGEPGWVPRQRRTKAELAAEAAAKVAAAEAALQAEKEAAAGPFNSLTAHLNAYTQRDKALLREGAGYGKIPDLSPEEILIRRKEAAIREAARAAEEKRKEEARLAQVAREEARVAREAKEEARREAHRLALLEAARPAENDNQGGLMDIDLSGFGDIDAEIDEEADYEAQRQARIAHNNRIMAALGLGEIHQPSPEEVEPKPSKRGRGRPLVKVPKRKREPRYSPDGTTADPCPSGQRQRLAFVELPHIFRSQRVQDLFRYSQLPPVPENPIESESEDEDEIMDADATTLAPKARAEKLPPVHYSQIDGDPCHQCRRKSNKPKMSCRNKDPQCNLKYCNTCVQRYNFPFEEYSRTFICPRCQGYCNCSACLRSSGLLKLLKLDENQDKLRMSLNAAKTAPNIQVYLEMMGAPKAPPMPQQELHRIRFIHKEEDIITPEIPDDVLSELMTRHHKRKHYAKAGVGPKKSKKKAKTKPSDDTADADLEAAAASVRPQPRKRKGKEKVDETASPEVEAVTETATLMQTYPEHPAQEDSDDLSDDEEAEYAAQHRYTPQYDCGTGDARRPATSSLDGPGYRDQHYAIANAWSVYRA